MSVIHILIGLGLIVALGFLAAFLWAVRSGQYDDICTPSMRILHDEEPPFQRAQDMTSQPENSNK